MAEKSYSSLWKYIAKVWKLNGEFEFHSIGNGMDSTAWECNGNAPGLRINNLDLAIPLELVNTGVAIANLVNPMGQWNLISHILWALAKL